MHGRAHRKTVCLSNSEAEQDTLGERKGMGILSNEEASTSDTHTHTHTPQLEET